MKPSSSLCEVRSSAFPDKATFEVYDTDEVIGHTFRSGSWWESWMHEHFARSAKEHCRESDVVLDIGANIGSHSVALSKILPQNKIIAFEPQQHVCHLLRNNLDSNAATNVQMLCHALSDVEGLSSFPRYDPHVDHINQGGQSLHDDHDGERVKLRPLDAVLADEGVSRVCMMKIDVEGHENKVFEGATDMITRDRPVIYFEDGYGNDTRAYLEARGYCVSNLEAHGGWNDYYAEPC